MTFERDNLSPDVVLYRGDCLEIMPTLEIVLKSREVSGYVGLDGTSSVKESGNAAAVVEFADGASDTGLSGGVVGEVWDVKQAALVGMGEGAG